MTKTRKRPQTKAPGIEVEVRWSHTLTGVEYDGIAEFAKVMFPPFAGEPKEIRVQKVLKELGLSVLFELRRKSLFSQPAEEDIAAAGANGKAVSS